MVQEEREVDRVLSAPEDLSPTEGSIRVFRRHDQGGSRAVEDVRFLRRLPVGVQNHPQGIPTLRVLRFHSELRVVHQDRSDTDENRIGFGSEAMNPTQVLLVAQAHRLPVGECDLPIDAHCGIDDHAGSHGQPMGGSNNKFAGSGRSSSIAVTWLCRRKS